MKLFNKIEASHPEKEIYTISPNGHCDNHKNENAAYSETKEPRQRHHYLKKVVMNIKRNFNQLNNEVTHLLFYLGMTKQTRLIVV